MFKNLVFTWYSTNTWSIASKTIRETPDKREQADSYTKQDPADLFDCSGSPEGSDQFKLCGHKLVVTGRDPIPVEINKCIVIRRCNLKTVQEETDVIMSQQMIAISEVLDGAGIRIMFDDTDVFVLLLHFYCLREM